MDQYAWAIPGPHPLRQPPEPRASRPTSTSTTAATRSGPWSKSTSPGSSSPRSGSRSAAGSWRSSASAPVQETEGRVYQQVEIPSGPFRRVVELQVEVDAERAVATYEDGVLRIELPLRDPERDHPPGPDRARRDGGLARSSRSSTRRSTPRTRSAPTEPLPEALPVLPLRDSVTFPETLTPLAVGQERSIKLVDDVLGANRMLVMVASRDPENEEPGPDRPLRRRRRRRRRPDGQSPRRHAADPRPGRPSGSGSTTTSPSSPTWSRGSPSCPTRSSGAPSWRR